MFNESNNFVELNGYIKGFTFMTNAELWSFLSDNRLSFSINQILYIQSYFKNVKKMFPTYNQIFLFDKINRLCQAQKKGYSIHSVSATDEKMDILETSNDFLSKRNALKPNFFGAMPISYASSIASEYLRSIGVSEYNNAFIPAKANTSAEYFIHTDNNVPLFSRAEIPVQEKAQTTSVHNTLVMLCPTREMSDAEYYANVEEFLSLSEIKVATSEHSAVSQPFGLFEHLIKESNGILVNLANIPEVETNENGKVEDLSIIFSACLGRRFFATNNASVGILNRLAEAYSLSVCIFAIRNNSRLFSFESVRHPAFSFNFSFLENIMSFTEEREYLFTDEGSAPIGKKESVYLTCNTNSVKQTYRAEKIFKFGNIISTATACSLDVSPFRTAALSVIDAINVLVAKGIAKSSISLSIHYSLLSGTDNTKELGRNLAAILGAYRSMIELCVSDSDPQISYNESNRSIVVVASSKIPKRALKPNFSGENSNLYLYQLDYSESGLPNYEGYREFIKYFYSLIEEDKILSAFAVNENPSAVLKNALQGAEVDVSNIIGKISNDNIHGILFETSEIIDIKSNITRVSNDI